MQLAITLVSPQSGTVTQNAIAAALDCVEQTAQPDWLAPETACDLMVDTPDGFDLKGLRTRLDTALGAFAVDFAAQPATNRRKKLLVADMDSTIIGQECIDEIAVAAGVHDRVAEITARAMAGELDFEAALAERVALLAGISERTLADIMDTRITPNPGAATLVETMRHHGARTLLVSGGFTFCAARIAEKVGFDAYHANTLIFAEGRLTGEVEQPVLGREAKLARLLAECERLSISSSEAIGLGDGANDLLLVENAGLGIAYRAKPVLARAADARIDHTDLTTVLYFQGYRREDLIAR